MTDIQYKKDLYKDWYNDEIPYVDDLLDYIDDYLDYAVMMGFRSAIVKVPKTMSAKVLEHLTGCGYSYEDRNDDFTHTYYMIYGWA